MQREVLLPARREEAHQQEAAGHLGELPPEAQRGELAVQEVERARELGGRACQKKSPAARKPTPPAG